MTCHCHIIQRHGVEPYLAGHPDAAYREHKRAIIDLGLAHPTARSTVLTCDAVLKDMEEILNDRRWLVGDDYSLTDVALTPYVNRLAMGMAGMWEEGRLPHVEHWFDEMKSRASFQPAVIDCLPEELASDLMHYGSTAWPEIRAI